jgi:hypothetical protein
MSYQVEPLNRDQLDEILRDYVCSTCWGPLTFRYVDGQWFALCSEHKEATTGYASKKFAERKREQSGQELIEAERNLRDVLGLRPEKQTVEKNLSDLGF